MKETQEKKEQSFTLTFIGNSYSGKTSLINRFNGETVESKASTIAPAITRIELNLSNEKVTDNLRLTIVDASCQELFEVLDLYYIKLAKGIIIVYDVTNRKTFIDINKWLIIKLHRIMI